MWIRRKKPHGHGHSQTTEVPVEPGVPSSDVVLVSGDGAVLVSGDEVLIEVA